MAKKVSPTPADNNGSFPWKQWFKLRAYAIGFVALIFLAMYAGATLYTNHYARDLRQSRDAAYRIAPAELNKLNAELNKVYATLPSGTPLVYEDANRTCTATIDGIERVVCFKGKGYAKLTVKQEAPDDLTTSDQLANAFEQAAWRQTKYDVVAGDKTAPRQESASPDPSAIRMTFRSPKIDNVEYCAALIYNKDSSSGWSGALRRCEA